MQRRATTLASKVHIDREEGLARALEWLPLCDERLAAVAPCLGGRLDAARVVGQDGPAGVFLVGDDLGLVVGTALVGVVELDDVGAVPIPVSFTVLFLVLELNLLLTGKLRECYHPVHHHPGY